MLVHQRPFLAEIRLIERLICLVMLATPMVVVGGGGDDKSDTAPADVTATRRSNAPVSGYFDSLLLELKQQWPQNRNLRFVFHGHSVPAGFFKTPQIRRFDSYPLLFQRQMCDAFPFAQIDVSVTAIGGENSKAGAARFEADVLALNPDVVFIDYSLNDRKIGLKQSAESWRQMIRHCIARDIRIVLLTPTPDSRERIVDEEAPLAQHANQVKDLAREFHVPVVDCYGKFRELVGTQGRVLDYLSQVNHPNREGHLIVTKLLTSLFVSPVGDVSEITGDASAPLVEGDCADAAPAIKDDE